MASEPEDKDPGGPPSWRRAPSRSRSPSPQADSTPTGAARRSGEANTGEAGIGAPTAVADLEGPFLGSSDGASAVVQAAVTAHLQPTVDNRRLSTGPDHETSGTRYNRRCFSLCVFALCVTGRIRVRFCIPLSNELPSAPQTRPLRRPTPARRPRRPAGGCWASARSGPRAWAWRAPWRRSTPPRGRSWPAPRP